jgi:hypothetical protein
MKRENLGPGEVELGTQGPDAREQFFAVLVFLFLIIPSMVLSFFGLQQGTLGFVFTAFTVILRDLALVSLILFFIWIWRRAFGAVGLEFQEWLEGLVLGDRLVPAHVPHGRLAR